MKKKSRIWYLPLSVGGISIDPPSKLDHITNNTNFLGGNIIGLAIQLMLTAAVLFALFFLIWGGIKWILSGGDKHGVEAARATIIYAVIGLVIALSGFIILSIIGYFFNINLLSLPTS